MYDSSSEIQEWNHPLGTTGVESFGVKQPSRQCSTCTTVMLRFPSDEKLCIIPGKEHPQNKPLQGFEGKHFTQLRLMAGIITWEDHAICGCYSLMLSIFLCSLKASDCPHLLAQTLKITGYYVGTKLSKPWRKAHLSYSITRNLHLPKQSWELTALQKSCNCLYWGFTARKRKPWIFQSTCAASYYTSLGRICSPLFWHHSL